MERACQGTPKSHVFHRSRKIFHEIGRVLRPWTPGPVGKYGGHGGPLGHRRPGHQRPPAAPVRPSKPASNHHRRCAASSRSARRPSTTAVAPFSSWLAQPAETGVRMLLAAVFVPAGLAVLAARSLQPISRADALHTRMSDPAALHIAMPVAAVHQSLAHDCRWQISACWHGCMDFATAQWKPRGDCKVANPRVGFCRRFSIAV